MSAKEIDDINEVVHHDVTIRAFYKCDEADLVPSITLKGKLSNKAITLDVGKMVQKLAGEIDGKFFTNVRPMKSDEVAAYIAKEDEDAKEFSKLVEF